MRNAPTYWGTMAYEIVSDADHGKMDATVEVPSRQPPPLLLRIRHPKAARIQGVTVNGRPWKQFNPDKEVIELQGLTGKVAVTARY